MWMVGAGAVLAIHWSSYMQSIQSSTVAVGTLTVSTFPIFVIFLEPYLFHEKLKKSECVLYTDDAGRSILYRTRISDG